MVSTSITYKILLKNHAFISALLFFIGGGLSVFVLNHFYSTGNVAPYLPTALLSVLFLIIASISTFFTAISSILSRQSKLMEEILYTLRKNSDFEAKEDR